MSSILKTDIEKKVLELAESLLADKGFRVLDLDCRLGSRSLLRIYLDRKDASSEQVTLQNCAEMSRLLDPVFEASGIFTGAYDLEVSSPGLDRRLRLSTDFEKAVGNEVKLSLVEKLENLGANIRGQVLRVEPDNIVLAFEGKEVPVRIGKIKKANLVWSEKNGIGIR